MILTAKQEKGLNIAVERYQTGQKYTCIAGYAGSGKSTLIKFIIAALDVDPDKDVCYVAFTGKAATVLQSKGHKNATTAHQLLYHARQKPDGTFAYSKKDSIDYPIVVVDEISMLPRPMWELLMSHHCYILAMGDPGQLPPIDKDMDNHVLDNPHVFLDEIMRQAQDSEIIRLSMWVREGKALSEFPCENKQVQIYSATEVVSGMYDWADQILCATNAKRNAINNFVRKQKGFGDQPEIGDKIISLHNHWDDISYKGNWSLTNGSIGEISNFSIRNAWLPKYIYDKPLTYMYTHIELGEGDFFYNVPIDYKALNTGEATLTPRQSYLLKKNKNTDYEPPYDFAYAYAITCHKAQGSEWDKILIFEEGFPFDKEEHKRWLYTAITRAKDKVVIIRK